MINKNTEPAKLVNYTRDGLVEREHFGYIVRCDRIHLEEKVGDDKNYPFYLRSCAKPLQASLLIDYEMDKKYNLTEEEIAICCASHAGEKVHIDILKCLLDKMEINENMLKCGVGSPISKTAQNQLLTDGQTGTVLHNNCSGKHAMMLGLCKLNDWDMTNYDNINHPLQQAIKNKIYELCEVKSEYPVTKDGCGVPIHSMPLINMAKGYLNLFCDTKYEKLKNAFINNSYIIGGEDRTDTKIMQNSKNIVAKVGAGGLCIVVNTDIEEAFVVKISDADIIAREIVTIDLINNLHWEEIKISHDIETNHHEIIGKIVSLL